MEYNDLEINIDINACGYGRGYYEVNYDELKKDLDEYLSTINKTPKKELKNIIREFINEYSYRYKGDFVFVRDDMEEEVYIEVN